MWARVRGRAAASFVCPVHAGQESLDMWSGAGCLCAESIAAMDAERGGLAGAARVGGTQVKQLAEHQTNFGASGTQ